MSAEFEAWVKSQLPTDLEVVTLSFGDMCTLRAAFEAGKEVVVDQSGTLTVAETGGPGEVVFTAVKS